MGGTLSLRLLFILSLLWQYCITGHYLRNLFHFFYWFVCQNIVNVIVKIRYILWGIGVFERCIWEWSSGPYFTIGHLTPLLHTCRRLEGSSVIKCYVCIYLYLSMFLSHFSFPHRVLCLILYAIIVYNFLYIICFKRG